MSKTYVIDGLALDCNSISIHNPEPTGFKPKNMRSLGEYRYHRYKSYTRQSYYKNFANARRKVKPLVDKVSAKLNLDTHASEALLDVVAIMRSAKSDKDRLAAAKIVLDFTMSKPTSKSEVKVATAEDWLKSIADK